MKLTIELNDAELQATIGAALKQKVAEIASEYIEKEVERIMTTKFSRVDPRAATESAAMRIVSAYANAGYNNPNIKDALHKAAITLLRESKL